MEWLGQQPPPLGMSINEFHWQRKGLVGHWQFDEQTLIHGSRVEDISLYKNHGTLSTGDGSTNKSKAGKLGRGVQFDGSNDYVDAGTSSLSDVMTIMGWVKISGGTRFPLLSFSASGYGVHPIWNATTQSLIYLGSSNYRYFATNIADGQWHHVAFVITGVGQTDITNARMYADGQSQALSTLRTDTAVASKDILRIGRAATFNANGSIDDVRIYNRALTAGEVAYIRDNPFAYREAGGLIVPQPKIPIQLIQSGEMR